MTISLDLNVSMPELTRTLLDIYSVSGEKKLLQTPFMNPSVHIRICISPVMVTP